MPREVLVLIIMIPFYGLAIFMIVRTFVVAFSFRDPVPFVPVESKLLKKAIQLLEIKPGDKVVDIGSGSGKFVFVAAKSAPDASFTGIDINWILINTSTLLAFFKRSKNVRYLKSDVREMDYSGYNKVYMYMTSGFVGEMMGKLTKELPVGAVVVSIAFGFGKKFESENSVEVYEVGKGKHDKVSVWRKR